MVIRNFEGIARMVLVVLAGILASAPSRANVLHPISPDRGLLVELILSDGSVLSLELEDQDFASDDFDGRLTFSGTLQPVLGPGLLPSPCQIDIELSTTVEQIGASTDHWTTLDAGSLVVSLSDDLQDLSVADFTAGDASSVEEFATLTPTQGQVRGAVSISGTFDELMTEIDADLDTSGELGVAIALHLANLAGLTGVEPQVAADVTFADCQRAAIAICEQDCDGGGVAESECVKSISWSEGSCSFECLPFDECCPPDGCGPAQ